MSIEQIKKHVKEMDDFAANNSTRLTYNNEVIYKAILELNDKIENLEYKLLG